MGIETGGFSLGTDAVAESLQSAEFNTIPGDKSIVANGGFFALGNETVTLHTVTAGKVLYVKQIIIQRGVLSAGSGHIKVGDNVSGALAVDTIYDNALIFPPDLNSGVASVVPIKMPSLTTLPIPLRVLTQLDFQTDSTISETTLSFVGWEENL